MSREEELEKEWRLQVSKALVGIDAKADEIEKDVQKIQIELARQGGFNIIKRVGVLEGKVENLNNFKSRVITAVVVAQFLIGIILAGIKFFIE
jgi:hypothetical protein